jgi:hypothetical protein
MKLNRWGLDKYKTLVEKVFTYDFVLLMLMEKNLVLPS